MSLYCNGNNCDKKESCCYYTRNPGLEAKGFENCVWHIIEEDCIRNGYADYVEDKTKRHKT